MSSDFVSWTRRCAIWFSPVGERAWLDRQPRAWQDALGVLFFSAKEAYYKCQFAVTGSTLGFHDVELEIDLPGGRFVANLLSPGFPARVERLGGRFQCGAGRIACGVELR
jgi:4'-phosphopantetheinyl transferase EntD